MKKSFKPFYLFFFVSFAVISIFSSCHKTSDTTATVTVRDKDNALVIGAWVRLYGNSTTTKTSIVNDSLQSDYKGEAHFNYNKIYQAGQAGVAVLDVVARKGILYGKTIVKIDAEVDNKVTVFIQ